MSDVVVLMSAILAGELLLVLLVLLSYAWFRNRALRRRDAKAVRVLATRIKNTRTERETTIAQFLGEQMGISGEALEQAQTAMLHAELLLLQRFAGVYKKRDAGAAAQFDMDLMAALAPYYELEGGGIVVTQEQPDEDTSVLESLRAENQRLSDELSVTMETMSRMLNEYSTMFTGGSLGQPAPIAALAGGAVEDVTGPEGETVLEPVAGQTAPPFDPDTPVEMAAEAEFAVDLEADAETGIEIEADLAAPAVDIEAGDNLETVAEFLEEEGPAEVISFDEPEGLEVELAMQEDQLFDSAESETIVRAEEAAGDLLDDAGAEGSIDVDALFDGVDEPIKKHSGH